MKRTIYLITLLIILTGCTAINDLNKKLEEIHKSLPTYSESGASSSTTSGSKEVINLNVATKGLGKFENAKIIIMPEEFGTREILLTGYYINTSKYYQDFVEITADVYDKDGDRVDNIYFAILDVRPGEKKNISKIKMSNNGNGINTNFIKKGQIINDKSWKFEVH